jgi:pimeloyl-ACP methyl ester carboxylesterase
MSGRCSAKRFKVVRYDRRGYGASSGANANRMTPSPTWKR